MADLMGLGLRINQLPEIEMLIFRAWAFSFKEFSLKYLIDIKRNSRPKKISGRPLLGFVNRENCYKIAPLFLTVIQFLPYL